MFFRLSLIVFAMNVCFDLALLRAARAEEDLQIKEGVTLYSKGDSDGLVGAYQQPRWTTARLFSGTRSYLIPKNSLETEFWFTMKNHRDGAGSEFFFQQEIEAGLIDHVQLDVYINEIKSQDQAFALEGAQLEIRYAFADWGKIFLNPTLYFEYHPRRGAPDRAEVRLLLSETLAPSWHWAANLAAESELSGALIHEYALTTGVGRALFESRLSLGLEGKAVWVDAALNRGAFDKEYYLGPSAQWKFHPRMHVELTGFAGLNHGADAFQSTLILGADLR